MLRKKLEQLLKIIIKKKMFGNKMLNFKLLFFFQINIFLLITNTISNRIK